MILPLIAAGARLAIGAAGNRRETRRKRGLIQQAYRNSADHLVTRQSGVRQSEAESLAARGLLQGGQEHIGQASESNSTDATVTRPGDVAAAGTLTPQQLATVGHIPTFARGAIQKAMMAAQGMKASQFAKPTSAPRSLAGQTQADTERELGMEWRDLDHERTASETGLTLASQNRTISDVGAAVDTGVAVHSAQKSLAAGAGGAATGDYGKSAYPGGMFASPIVRASMTGVDDPGNWFGGIHGLDPLGAPGSSWNRKAQDGGTSGTMLGTGQSNAEFHV